jgi:hypothetical protein
VGYAKSAGNTLRNLVNSTKHFYRWKTFSVTAKMEKVELLILTTHTMFHSASLSWPKSPFPPNVILSPLEGPSHKPKDPYRDSFVLF